MKALRIVLCGPVFEGHALSLHDGLAEGWSFGVPTPLPCDNGMFSWGLEQGLTGIASIAAGTTLISAIVTDSLARLIADERAAGGLCNKIHYCTPAFGDVY